MKCISITLIFYSFLREKKEIRINRERRRNFLLSKISHHLDHRHKLQYV